MGMLGHRVAAQIAHDHQDMLIDGVGMKQIMLHLPDNPAEVGQITSEYAHLIHAPQRMCDATRRLNI
jgi:hypothetical protein